MQIMIEKLILSYLAFTLIGGRANKNETLSDVERYNPSTNAWSSVESISSPRRYVAIATLSGRLYAVGGSGNDIISRRVERYRKSLSCSFLPYY